QHAPQLTQRGYYPLVIGPGTKQPMEYVPSEDRYQLIRNWSHPRRPVDTSPQPGAGVGLRCGKQPDGTYVIGLDWDRDDAALAAMESFPATVMKEGRRGYTGIYRSSKPIPSRDFLIKAAAARQFLSDGKQTVLRPSIHPDTNEPFRWGTDYTPYNTKPSELPELPEDYIACIEAILRPLGYAEEPPKPERES